MAYSYSRLETYRQCPRKYKYQYVDKLSSVLNTKWLDLGLSVHEAIEKNDIGLVMNDALALELFRRGRNTLETLDVKKLELKLAVDKSGVPVEFDSEDALFRGVVDVLGDNFIMDWKTGYSECTPLQLSLYTLLARAHGYDVDRAGYCMLRSDKTTWFDIDTDLLEHAKAYLIETISRIENETAYAPILNDYCKYCPFAKQCAEDGVEQDYAAGLVHQLFVLEGAIKQVKQELKQMVQENGDIQVGDKVYGITATTKPRCKNKTALTQALNEQDLLGEYGEVASGIYCRLLDEHPEFSDYFSNAVSESIGFKEFSIG